MLARTVMVTAIASLVLLFGAPKDALACHKGDPRIPHGSVTTCDGGGGVPINTSLVVVDGTGTPFATVLDVNLADGLVTAVAEIQGFIGLLQVSVTPTSSSNFLEGILTSNIDLFWTSDDCSGIPYLRQEVDAVVPNLFDVFKISFELDVGNSDARPLYVNSGPPAMRSLPSHLIPAGGGGFTCEANPLMLDAIPLMLIDPDISMTYPPPYSVQLQ